MTISKEARLKLKKQAHHLNPVVMIGSKGLTAAVQLEIERALLDHELIKIKIHAENKEERKEMIETICKARDAEFIGAIGYVAIIYRKNID